MRQTTICKIAIASLVSAALLACDTTQLAPLAATQDVDAFAQRFMNTIQADSISESREFCGYFVLQNGQLAATAPRRGTEASCNYGPVPTNTVASYHTHGSYGEEFDNEVPSGFDLESARQFGIDDYVSTPGGRFWRVDGGSGNATQICGLGCLVSDPNFVPRNEGDVARNYTIESLRDRQEG